MRVRVRVRVRARLRLRLRLRLGRRLGRRLRLRLRLRLRRRRRRRLGRTFAELAVEPARHDRLAHGVGGAAAVGALGLVDELLREAERHLEHARAELRARHDLRLLQCYGQRRQHALLAVGGQRQGRVAARRDDVAHGRAEGRGVAGCA